MLTAGIAVTTGVIVACFSPQLVDRYWVSWLPICLFLALVDSRWRWGGLFVCGFLWATLHLYWHLDHRLAFELDNKRLRVVGEVINIPQFAEGRARFLFKPLKSDKFGLALPSKIRLSWQNAPEQLAPGQHWQLRVKLKRPHGFQNPGAFDYERWLLVQGIGATGYVIDDEQNQPTDEHSFSIHYYRHLISRYLRDACPACAQAGLIEALAIGFRGHIEDHQRQRLQQTGTAHLIAISGLHIGIIAGVFYVLGNALWNLLLQRSRMTRRGFALSMAWCAALVYSLISGFELPAQRAMLMLSVLLLMQALRLPVNLLHSVFCTLLLVMIVSPLSVLSSSFWLTFCALLVIVFGAWLFQGQRSRLKQLLLIQWLFTWLFMPLSIAIFGQVHSASLLANLLAVPLVSLIIVPFNFLLLLLFWLPTAWLQFLYRLLDGLLHLLMEYLQWLDRIGLQALSLAHVELWKLMLLTLILVIFLLPRGIFRGRRYLGVFPLFLLWPQQHLQPGQFQVAVLDVGMGTSIVVQTQHHSLIYDVGPGNADTYSLGEWAVLPYLQYQGIRHVDRIILSHADQDHAGGFYAIQQQFRETPLYTGTLSEIRERFPEHSRLVDCHSTANWHWDGIDFEFVRAAVSPADSENNRSCVLRISTGRQRILITGDIEKRQELRLLSASRSRLAADILLAPHHGSLTSSSPAFVQTVNASDVIFTTGYHNRWGFPRPTVVSRYQSTGARLYRTDEEGAILIHCDPLRCDLSRYRQNQPRIWY